LQPTTVPVRVVTKQYLADTSFVDSLLPKPIWRAIDSGVSFTYLEDVSHFPLLLSPLADSCRYALQPDSAIASFDTIQFYYTRRLQFLSNACGFTHFYSLDKVTTTRHNIDSVKITNTDVNLNASSPEHVQIIF
jgi:hypothetical protein